MGFAVGATSVHRITVFARFQRPLDVLSWILLQTSFPLILGFRRKTTSLSKKMVQVRCQDTARGTTMTMVRTSLAH